MGGTTRSADAVQEAIARAQAMANPAPVVKYEHTFSDAIQESIDRAQATGLCLMVIQVEEISVVVIRLLLSRDPYEGYMP
jgi:flavin-binding protein dodecin